MKFDIRRYIPKKLLKTLKPLYKRIKFRKVINYYHTSYDKNVLISYLTLPFRMGPVLSHTNTNEVLEIARVFNEMGFNVDIYNYDSNESINYSKYDVVFGFGDPLENSFYERKRSILTIFYGTGTHVCFQNHATLGRIEEVFRKKGRILLNSARIIEKTWTVSTTLVDSIITLGNSFVVETYRRYYNKKIYDIPISFYKVCRFEDIKKDYGKAGYNFLWFGSSGLIHKGLDLLLEVFKRIPNIHLHICGFAESDPDFEDCYYDELHNTPNIHTYGFIDLASSRFKELLSICGFVIFPSCSEGGGGSVINVMGNGGLIPIVTKEASIDIYDFGFEIKGLSEEEVLIAINRALNLTEEDIEERTKQCYKSTLERHSIENFKKEFQRVLTEILLEGDVL